LHDTVMLTRESLRLTNSPGLRIEIGIQAQPVPPSRLAPQDSVYVLSQDILFPPHPLSAHPRFLCALSKLSSPLRAAFTDFISLYYCKTLRTEQAVLCLSPPILRKPYGDTRFVTICKGVLSSRFPRFTPPTLFLRGLFPRSLLWETEIPKADRYILGRRFGHTKGCRPSLTTLCSGKRLIKHGAG